MRLEPPCLIVQNILGRGGSWGGAGGNCIGTGGNIPAPRGCADHITAPVPFPSHQSSALWVSPEQATEGVSNWTVSLQGDRDPPTGLCVCSQVSFQRGCAQKPLRKEEPLRKASFLLWPQPVASRKAPADKLSCTHFSACLPAPLQCQAWPSFFFLQNNLLGQLF